MCGDVKRAAREISRRLHCLVLTSYALETSQHHRCQEQSRIRGPRWPRTYTAALVHLALTLQLLGHAHTTMYPYTYNYDPTGTPQYVYDAPAYRARSDPQYLQVLAEEEAARRQYVQALREQEEARNRAARARLARQTFEQPSYDSYLADEDDYGYSAGPRVARGSYPAYTDYPYLTPQEQRALLQERQRTEQQRRGQQRRIEAIERERELERRRIRALEEERKKLLEEERRRRIMLEEEERQRRRSEERRLREEEEYLKRQTPPATAAFLPLEELLGFRPSRSLQPEMVSRLSFSTLALQLIICASEWQLA